MLTYSHLKTPLKAGIRLLLTTAVKLSVQKPIVLVGPSGAGKTTFTKFITSQSFRSIDNPESQIEGKDLFYFSVSSTTRQPRLGEKNQVDYQFIDKEEFRNLIESDQFLEYQMVHDNYYGTNIDQIQENLDKGKICLLDIDLKGAMQISKYSKMDCLFVYISPPNIKVLENRLTMRGTENPQQLKIRLNNAMKEMSSSAGLKLFDLQLTNHTYKQFTAEAASKILRDCYGYELVHEEKSRPASVKYSLDSLIFKNFEDD